ncbi:Desiccation-like protein [Citrus sinensis]|uniref:Desiccation-like protein n=1 Tax=Citrus sinensis TaxID=2711 RepID=A0ACB8IBY9_CITSI|nr:Desiccation-like protein [Citrus sinensis]
MPGPAEDEEKKKRKYNETFGKPLNPPLDPYANSINYLIASYLNPYVGLTGYVGANPNLQDAVSQRLVAGLLGVESGQDAVIRTLLYEKANEKVHPYGTRVAEFTNKISQLRNNLGHSGVTKDEGLVVPRALGAEELLRIVYGSGNESVPGAFYPKGGDGRIAKSHLHTTY